MTQIPLEAEQRVGCEATQVSNGTADFRISISLDTTCSLPLTCVKYRTNKLISSKLIPFRTHAEYSMMAEAGTFSWSTVREHCIREILILEKIEMVHL